MKQVPQHLTIPRQEPASIPDAVMAAAAGQYGAGGPHMMPGMHGSALSWLGAETADGDDMRQLYQFEATHHGPDVSCGRI